MCLSKARLTVHFNDVYVHHVEDSCGQLCQTWYIWSIGGLYLYTYGIMNILIGVLKQYK